jgi:isopenicillin N synthase-like dioxygenase
MSAATQAAAAIGPVSTADRLPQVDLHPFLFGDRPARLAVARQVAEACRHYGFFYLHGHGVPAPLRTGGFDAAQRFFSLPLEDRMACRPVSARQNRGYQPMFDTVHAGSKPDLKESFDMGYPLPADDADLVAGVPFHSINTWPTLPGFRHQVEALYHGMLDCGRQVLRAMALGLDADENFFVGRCRKPTTNMRLVHYPPQDPQPDAGIGASAHTDRGIVTLLLNDRNGGLHVQGEGGDWIDAPPEDEAIIVNVGDLMTRWTNGRFRSAVHRVVNATGRERYSIPQFHHPNYHTVVDPRELPDGGEARFEPVVAGDFVANGFRRDRKSWAEPAPAATSAG